MEKVAEAIAAPGLHEQVMKILKKLPGVDVLDVPTGYGALTEKLLAMGKNITAGDLNTDKCRLSPHDNLRLVQLDLNDPVLPLPECGYDVALCVEGIEHLYSQWGLVKNLFRVLRPGGYLVLTTPNTLNFASRFRYFIEGRYEHFKRPLVKDKSWPHDLENYHIAPVSYFELQFILESCGFSILDVQTNRLASKHFFSVLLRPLFKFIYTYKDKRDRRRNRGTHKGLYETIMSDAVYYGECLIVVARKPTGASAST